MQREQVNLGRPEHDSVTQVESVALISDLAKTVYTLGRASVIAYQR